MSQLAVLERLREISIRMEDIEKALDDETFKSEDIDIKVHMQRRHPKGMNFYTVFGGKLRSNILAEALQQQLNQDKAEYATLVKTLQSTEGGISFD